MSVLSATEPQARSTSAAEPEEPALEESASKGAASDGRAPEGRPATERARDWPIPPTEGYFADDLDRIPDLPPHTELIDGSLVFVSPQKLFHLLVIDLLRDRLAQQAPDHLRSRREMSVTLGPRQRPEPDVLLVDAAAEPDTQLAAYLPESVTLVVEVVSPDSEVRDRKRKPQLYAEGAIPHLWRVENDGGRPVVYVYELDPATNAYVASGIHRERLKLAVPFDIDIDLTEIDRM